MQVLYQRLLPFEFMKELRRKLGVRQNRRVYTAEVVMWLMVAQRLQGKGTLETGVLELIRGLPGDFWPDPCKRIRLALEDSKPILSDNTGSYNEARHALPEAVVEQCFDQVTETLIREARESAATAGQAFILDGTTVRTPHTSKLCEAYPPARNQHRESHWPVIRMLAIHDIDTGLALRPKWGSQEVSEQRLLEQIIDRVPEGATVVGDTNFGVFTVAYAADQAGHPVVLRMQLCRAQRICPEPLRDGIDREICWKPSAQECNKHGLPKGACVRGRLVVRQVQPSNGEASFLLALFTTRDGGSDEAVQVFGKRWNIETDLRSLKCTLALEQLSCISEKMVNKEILTGMLAYNLVRALGFLAAQGAGVPPRTLSFTRVRNVLNAFGPLIAAAKDDEEALRIYEKMMCYVSRAKNRELGRTKRRSYPREVWGRPQVFPKRKS